MPRYTCTIEAGTVDETNADEIWQTLTTEEFADESRNPCEVAHAIASNQSVADGDHWRVRVWIGHIAKVIGPSDLTPDSTVTSTFGVLSH